MLSLKTAKAVKLADPKRVGANDMVNGDCVEYNRTVSVGFVTVCSRSTSVMVLVEEAAVMLVALLIVRVDPVAGRKTALDAATWVYPLRFSTGGGMLGANGKALRAALEVRLVAGAVPVPPVSQ